RPHLLKDSDEGGPRRLETQRLLQLVAIEDLRELRKDVPDRLPEPAPWNRTGGLLRRRPTLRLHGGLPLSRAWRLAPEPPERAELGEMRRTDQLEVFLVLLLERAP